MYLFGGVYADLDMEALQPLEPLLAHKRAALAWMGPPDVQHEYKEHNIPNAWMASEPGHPFWLMVLMRIIQQPKDALAEEVTGPVALKQTYLHYWLPTSPPELVQSLSVIEPGLIYPFDWAGNLVGHADAQKLATSCSSSWKQNADFDAARCKELVKGAYTVTYWRHSWSQRRALWHGAQQPAADRRTKAGAWSSIVLAGDSLRGSPP